jgi:hypothetical protein
MALSQHLDLLPSALYSVERETTIGSTTWGTLYSVDRPATEGAGRPLCIGRNDSVGLTLDVAEVVTPGRLDIMTETAASRTAPRWRPLGGFADVTSAGVKTLSLTGAAAWVRGRWKLTSGSFAFSLSGEATTTLYSAAQPVKIPGTGAAIDLRQYRSLRLTLDVTAASGGALMVTVETATTRTAPPSAWRTVALFDAVSVPASVDKAAVDLDRYVRIRWALPLGASALFTVAGVARLVLATPSDRRRLGIRGGAFPALTDEQADDLLYQASGDVLGPFHERYQEPLVSWEDDTRRACIAGADWAAIRQRGTEVGKRITPEDTAYYEAYVRYFGTIGQPAGGRGWVQRVGAEDEHPLGIVDSSMPEGPLGEAPTLELASEPLRGWGHRRRPWF